MASKQRLDVATDSIVEAFVFGGPNYRFLRIEGGVSSPPPPGSAWQYCRAIVLPL